jgi:hypothetical protein
MNALQELRLWLCLMLLCFGWGMWNLLQAEAPCHHVHAGLTGL